MEKNNDIERNDEIHIKEINPRTELNNKEKQVIKMYRVQREDELLSKTMQFKALNAKVKQLDLDLPKKKDNEVEMGIELPKKKTNLMDTIKLKISELRQNIEEKDFDLPKLKNKKSLYDTVILKLDDLINSKKALKIYQSKKVTNVEDTNKKKKKKLFVKDISKQKDIKLNVMSEEFGNQLYNLNKMALNNLTASCQGKTTRSRKYSEIAKLNRIEKIQISKNNYLQYQKKLSKFAINKLYYKFAPKETKKYKLYKASVILSSVIFLITGVIIMNWFIQGISINNMSYSLQEDTPIQHIDEGYLYNKDDADNQKELTENEKNMYFKYLNTPLSSVDFTDLLRQNKDTVGWLIVNNTNVNYPVVQATDNDYYLKHAFDGSYNSAGWVYADFRDDFNNFNRNTVIYAHGRKDKVMFGSLIDTLDESWYKNPDNQMIQLSTVKYNTMWQIVSMYKIRAESYYITTDFSSDDSYETFLGVIKDRSVEDFGINVSKDDKILTLSTCYNDSGTRLVIHAKLVKVKER